MQILEARPVINFINKIRPIAIFSPRPDDIVEYVDVGLERSSGERTEKIASFVREHGKYRFGPMWAEYTGFLKDGRDIFFQASGDALEINITSTGNGDPHMHIRYDREKKMVNTFEICDPTDDNQRVVYYHVSPQSARIPESLTRFEVSRSFASMLGPIEEAVPRKGVGPFLIE